MRKGSNIHFQNHSPFYVNKTMDTREEENFFHTLNKDPNLYKVVEFDNLIKDSFSVLVNQQNDIPDLNLDVISKKPDRQNIKDIFIHAGILILKNHTLFLISLLFILYTLHKKYIF